MTAEHQWTKESFETSVTSRAWAYTEFDADWDRCRDSAEIRALFAEEMALDAVPDWATEIVDRMLASPLPPCGHYSFPRPILQICEAIGREGCPDFVIGCYTADAERKRLMVGYVYCLDAWLKNAPLEAARAELALRGDGGRDWSAIVEAVYETLGDRIAARLLLVRRLVHRLRWWLKTLIWNDDRRDRFVPDAYLGDMRSSGERGDYGNPGFHDPYYAELNEPAVEELADQIRARVPEGKRLLERIESTWLCAPKAFRYLERLIVEIGGVGSDRSPHFDRLLLWCEDTYPDLSACGQWHASFLSSLDSWLAGDPTACPRLGLITPAKHWLVGMLRHRLQIYAAFTQYVAGAPGGRSGSRDIGA